MERPPDASVSLNISPVWDVFGGNQKWRASILFDGEVAFSENGETIDRALVNLLITLGRRVKAELDRLTRDAEQRRLEESR